MVWLWRAFNFRAFLISGFHFWFKLRLRGLSLFRVSDFVYETRGREGKEERESCAEREREKGSNSKGPASDIGFQNHEISFWSSLMFRSFALLCFALLLRSTLGVHFFEGAASFRDSLPVSASSKLIFNLPPVSLVLFLSSIILPLCFISSWKEQINLYDAPLFQLSTHKLK